MSLPGWVHCNECFYDSDSGVVFYLTSCGHIMCQCCIDSTCKNGNFILASSICKLCSHNGNIVEINSNMRSDIAALFSDPLSVLQKSFQQVAKVFFGDSHLIEVIFYIFQIIT
ncbi:hypothetical protein MXB_1458 [Myxobolus squamalis]|nr:hypothetical protein MXB_1458 [Myxobolus squamalis]